jgi:mono/diheme cytochrome c family protein
LRRWRRAPLAAILLGLACPATAVEVDREPGFQIAQQICAECHGIGIGLLSPDPRAPSFFVIANQPGTTELAFRVFLRTTHENMPNLIIEPSQIDDLLAYLRSLRLP